MRFSLRVLPFLPSSLYFTYTSLNIQAKRRKKNKTSQMSVISTEGPWGGEGSLGSGK